MKRRLSLDEPLANGNGWAQVTQADLRQNRRAKMSAPNCGLGHLSKLPTELAFDIFSCAHEKGLLQKLRNISPPISRLAVGYARHILNLKSLKESQLVDSAPGLGGSYKLPKCPAFTLDQEQEAQTFHQSLLASSLLAMAEKSVEKGDLDTAHQALLKAAQALPNTSEIYVEVGNVLKRIGRKTEAEASYRRAIHLKQTNVAAYRGLLETFRWLDKPEESLDICRTIVRLRPADAESHLALANALACQELREEAEQSYRETLRLTPMHEEAVVGLANSLYYQQRYAEAEDYLMALLDQNPNNAEAQEELWHVQHP